MSAGAAAVLMAAVAGFVWSGHRSAALRRLTGLTPRRPRPTPEPVRRVLRAPALRRRAPVALGAAVGALALRGHGALAVSLAVLVVAMSVPARRRALAAHRAELALGAALPGVTDLLATGLAAGLGPADAMRAVVQAARDPARAALEPVALALEMGLAPSVAWGPLVRRGGAYGRLGRAFVRAAETGAPLAVTAAVLAADERERLRWTSEAAARRAGVRAVGPLAVCFLPAFVLVGVVPLVVAVAREALGVLR